MKVLIQNHHDDTERILEGDAVEIEHALLQEYPWLEAAHDPADLQGLLEDLDSNQMYSASVLDEDAWLQPTPAPRMDKAIDLLMGEPLVKTVGYLTFPGLGIKSRPTDAKVVTTPQQLQTFLNLKQGGVSRKYDPYTMKDKPDLDEAEHYFHENSVGVSPQFGMNVSGEGKNVSAVKEGAGVPLHALNGHETQHAVFAEIQQRFGYRARREVARRLVESIPQNLQNSAHALAFASGYKPDYPHLDEEIIAGHQNYLMSAAHRKNVHAWAGALTPEKQQQFQTNVKQSWQHLLRRAREINVPGPVVKSESNLSFDGDSTTIDDMHGHEPLTHAAFEAAKLLALDRPAPSLDQVRRALWEFDGDHEKAALVAFGIDPSEINLRALRAVMQMNEGMHKAEQAEEQPKKVEAGAPEASGTADEVRRSFEQHTIIPVKLNGKHSVGTLIARDSVTGNVYLLKPGSGLQSPAAGAADDPASQSKREAAFYAVAEQWGLENSLSRADLIIVDGSEWAALHLLPFSFKSVQKVIATDPQSVLRALNGYREGGILHRWAVLDLVLGNGDRHSDNLMVDPNGTIKLIDHGSAFAGDGFHPAYDKSSFIPYYLRAWGPDKFNTLSLDQKVARMPTISGKVAYDFQKWVEGLDPDKLQAVISEYGINPEPALSRLARLKAMPGPKDTAVNTMWLTI